MFKNYQKYKKKIDYVVFSSKYMHSKKQLSKISSNYDVGINEQLKDKILNSKKNYMTILLSKKIKGLKI